MSMYISLVVLIFIPLVSSAQPSFRDIDLSQWTFFGEEKGSRDHPTYTFSSKGALSLGGDLKGYFRSRNVFSDYRLRFEWRWPEAAGNSGLFLHLNGEDHIWPRSVQVQLNFKRAGDVVLIGVGTEGKTKKESAQIENEKHPYYAFDRAQPSSERPKGEWNHCQIVAHGDTLSVTINGVLQNEITHLNLTAGRIAFQSAHHPVEFRKIEIESLGE